MKLKTVPILVIAVTSVIKSNYYMVGHYCYVYVPYHTRIYPIRVWDVPYAYTYIGWPYAYGMVYCPI